MKPQPEDKQDWFDKPKNVRLLRVVLYVCCAVVLLLDFVYHRHLTFKHGEFSAEGWFGFYPVYGFVTVILVVVVAVGMRKLLKREEDYYD